MCQIEHLSELNFFNLRHSKSYLKRKLKQIDKVQIANKVKTHSLKQNENKKKTRSDNN